MRGTLQILLFCFFMPILAMGQTEQGEIEDSQIEIRKDIAIKLPETAKPVEKINTPLKPVVAEPLTYSYTDYKLNLPDVDSKVKVITMKTDPLNEIFGTKVSGGIGTYFTTYLEGWHTAKRSDKIDYGIHFKHLAAANGPSSVNKSGSGNNKLEAWSTYYQEKFQISGDLAYNRDRYNFFGYRFSGTEREIKSDSLKQVFTNIRFRASIGNMHLNKDFVYKAGFEYSNFANSFNANESEIIIKGEGSYTLNKDSKLVFGTENSLIQYQDTTNLSRTLFQFRPAYSYSKNKLGIVAGVNVALDNDSLANNSPFRIYPNVQASYTLVPNKLTLYSGVTGDTRKRSLRLLTAENPWLAPKTTLSNSDEKVNAYIGLKGSSKDGFNWNLQTGYKSVSNFLTYLNSPTDSAKFLTVYDRGNCGIFNIAASAGYSNAQGFKMGLGFDYNNYSLDKLKQAWQIPAMQSNVMIGYLHKQKIGADLWVKTYSNLKTLQPSNGKEIELKGFVDLDLRLNYKLSDKGSVFVMADNLLSQKKQRYLYYQTRGIMLMAGGSYSF